MGSDIYWFILVQGLFGLVCLACLAGLIFACLRNHRGSAGKMGRAAAWGMVIFYPLLFAQIRQGGPLEEVFAPENAAYLCVLFSPPLVAVFLIVIGRRRRAA